MSSAAAAALPFGSAAPRSSGSQGGGCVFERSRRGYRGRLIGCLAAAVGRSRDAPRKLEALSARVLRSKRRRLRRTRGTGRARRSVAGSRPRGAGPLPVTACGCSTSCRAVFVVVVFVNRAGRFENEGSDSSSRTSKRQPCTIARARAHARSCVADAIPPLPRDGRAIAAPPGA